MGRWLSLLLMSSLSGLLALAVVGLVGLRLMVPALDDDRVNELVDRFMPVGAIRVRGLALDWSGWRPEVVIDEVRFGASVARGVYVVVAPIDSLRQGVPVFSDASAEQVKLHLARDAKGRFGLKDMPPPAGFNWRAVLWHSHRIAATGSIAWEDAGYSGSVSAYLRTAHQAGLHRLQVRAGQPDCQAPPCALEASVFHDSAAEDGLPLSLSLHTDGRFTLPAILAGGRRVALEGVEGLLFRDRIDAVPTLALAGRAELGSTDDTVAVRFGARGDGRLGAGDGQFWAEVEALGGGLQPEDSRFAGRLRIAQGAVDVLFDRFRLATVHRFISAGFEADSRLRRWIDALQPRGAVDRLRARIRAGERQLAWSADLSELESNGYRGVPRFQGFAASVTGYERGLSATLRSAGGIVGFPDVFTKLWPFASASADLSLHVREGQLSLWSDRIDLALLDTAADGTRETASWPVSGRARLYIPRSELDRRLALTVTVPELPVSLTKLLIPAGFSPELRGWLNDAPRAGRFLDATLAFAGDLKPVGQGIARETSRRVALDSRFAGVELKYLSDWPVLEADSGSLLISGRTIDSRVAAGTSRGIAVDGSRVRIPAVYGPTRPLRLDLEARYDLAEGLTFVRQSPLADVLSFVGADWSGSGSARMVGSLEFNLGSDDDPSGDLTLSLDSAALRMPDYGLAFTRLSGPASIKLPDQVAAEQLTGRLYGEPFSASVSSTREANRIVFQGRATPELVAQVLDLDSVSFAAGATQYRGTLELPLPASAARRDPWLEFQSSLKGVSLELPGELAKRAATERQTAVSVRFRDRGQTSEQWLSLTQPVVGGWLTLRDGLAVDGHVHVLGTPEAAAAGAPARFARRQLDRGSGGRGIRTTGGISSYDLAETGEGGLASLRFEFDDFHLADLRADELALGYVNLSGTLSDPLTELAVTGARLDGTVSWVDGQPMQLAFRSVLLPQMNGGGPSPASLDTREVTDALVPREPDPLPVTLVRELPEADVSLGSLRVGDEDFGRWQFKLRRQDDRLRIDALEADWLGLHITGDEVYWSRSPNETVFVGSLAGGNLDDVLPAWDYASPVTTEDVAVEVEVAWSGSPLNILLTELEGEAELTLRNGRFHEVEGAGNNALRLLSLLNFNAITRRMNLDFSDVFGRGVSFETLTARAALDHGRLVLLKPMEVEGTGSRFVMSGSVDVNTGLIDSEMIVTLPLTRGLPWYAAYVALAANPLAGLGVLVGERVLRKPLEQFSSAKYEVTGTLSDPDVRLVGIFNNKLKRIDPDEQVTEIPVAENEETKQRNDNGTGES